MSSGLRPADLSLNPPPHNPPPPNHWAPETSHANGHANGHPITSPPEPPSPPPPPRRKTPPSDPKSLSAISLRAFLLGAAFGVSLSCTFLALLVQSPFWRPPFFMLALSFFHFLEYYTTAAYNPSAATVSAFLLSQNGRAYNIAHTLAFIECVLHTYFSPPPHHDLLSLYVLCLSVGFGMIVVGQVTRTMAMVKAASNFNHLVQMKRKQGHVLVTDGIYAWLRHPSYFGFWWWGLGTQVVLGNWVCLVGYTIVLWRFFSRRIEKEEELLIEFFGKEYDSYRKRTSVGIPFIP